jgi:protoheme IX farnesyltransferase
MQTERINNAGEYAAVKKGRGGIGDYINVIKPRETALLVFIGTITALAAAGGNLSAGRILFVLSAILVASAGANGLTNYLDRHLDARMVRTRRRALPSGRIFPVERALYFTAMLTAIGLIMAWFLHPWAFAADLLGTTAAVIYRKRVTCVFPQGMIASCAPVLMGWFAVTPTFNWEILLMCILIAVWLPSHIWSIMTAHSEDYKKAGLCYFPMNSTAGSISRILFFFCLLLWAASIGLYFAGNFGYIYLIVAVISGMVIVYTSGRLMISGDSQDAWKLYKLSAFPYLGILFLAIGLDIWLRF